MTHKDPFAILKQDHQEVEEIFKQLEDTTERAEKTRAELFSQLKEALNLHAMIEEKYLYPVLEEEKDTETMAIEAGVEHDHVKQMLSEIEGADETSEEWTARLHVLMENVRHHVEEEEKELFPDAEKVLSEEQLHEMAENIAKAKEEGLPVSAVI